LSLFMDKDSNDCLWTDDPQSLPVCNLIGAKHF
jgi:hypothetical protein